MALHGTSVRQFRGALVRKASDLTAQDLRTGPMVAWDQETYDTDAFHDNVTNNSRLTIPVGVTMVRLLCSIFLVNNTIDTYANVVIIKNGNVSNYDGHAANLNESGLTSVNTQAFTPVIPVIAGDYFEVSALVESDTSVDFVAARSWFAIEVIS